MASPDFEERHRAFYAMLDQVFTDALFRQRFEPRGRPLQGDELGTVDLPPDTGDGPTPQREARAGEQVEEFVTESGRKSKRMLDDSVLELLNSRGSISGDQYVAGWAFYEDWYTAGMAASGVINPGREVVDGGTHKPVSERQLDAMWRWKRAMQAVGVVHSKALVCLVLIGEPLKSYGRRVYKRQQEKQATVAAITALSDALQALDWHYHGQRKTPRTQVSHLPDYRPTELPTAETTE